MNRVVVSGLIVALGSLACAQDLARKISVEVPASRASVALAEISKAAGIILQPAANLRDEVFVISVHDATVDEIMQRIAQAESGRWTKQGGGYLLERESSTSVAQERAEIQARAGLISRAIAKLGEGVAKQPKFDQDQAQKLAEETKRTLEEAMSGNGRGGRINLAGTGEKTPTARAISRILTSLDASKLAVIAPNQRVVFSTQPTAVQVALGNAGYSAFKQFIDEQVMYTQAYGNTQGSDGANRTVMINGFGTPTVGNGDPRLGLGVGLVVVERRFDNGLNVQILAADTKLDTIASGSYMLQLPRPDEAPASSAGELLKISDEAKELAKALNAGAGASGGPVRMMVFSSTGGGASGDVAVTAGGAGAAVSKVSAALRAKVLNPEQFDPLSFAPGEGVIALAQASKSNLIALLPDYCFSSLNRQFASDVTAGKLLADLGPIHGLVSKQEGGWMVISPSMPASGRASGVSRSALGGMLRNLDKTGLLRLNDVAAYATTLQHAPQANSIDMLYPRLINSSVADRELLPLAFGSFSLYKFYGSLSAGQRESLTAGKQMPFMNLSPMQLDLVADMLYNSPQGPNVQLEGNGDQQRTTTSTFTYSASSGGRGMPIALGGPLSAKTERTIAVPNGVVNEGYILGALRSQAVVQGINTETGATAILDPASLAFSQNMKNQPELAAFPSPQYDKYKMAHQATLSLRFVLNPRVMIARNLNDNAPDPDAQPVAYDALPADFRQRVEEVAKQIGKAMDNLPGRGQAPPPPPSA